MAPKFGTSGLRGLVSELTPELVRAHVSGFLAACTGSEGVGGGKPALWLGRDLRPSSPDIAAEVAAAALAAGHDLRDAGAVPTPALALVALAAGEPAIMVTGSHIPADRNGLKFYTASGEITKSDEAAITGAVARGLPPAQGQPGRASTPADVARRYAARLVGGFGPEALAGMRIGVWQHSTVARDLIGEVLAALGAEVVAFGRSETFIPVDTEAIAPGWRVELASVAAGERLDAVVSADGDGDRPLLADAMGRIVPGDVLGPLAARFLGADTVVTPVSSNTMVERLGMAVTRTRIGSPHVIAAMEAVLAADPGARVAGYEANGGFLLGFRAQAPAGPVAPLMTRDSLLPLVAVLAAARQGGGVAAMVADLPARVTATGLLSGIAREGAVAFLDALSADPQRRGDLLAAVGLKGEAAIDRTDGLRMTDANGVILHLRPSGNAPEFRIYVEDATAQHGEVVLDAALVAVAAALGRQRS